jgi:hypothetical protein
MLHLYLGQRGPSLFGYVPYWDFCLKALALLGLGSIGTCLTGTSAVQVKWRKRSPWYNSSQNHFQWFFQKNKSPPLLGRDIFTVWTWFEFWLMQMRMEIILLLLNCYAFHTRARIGDDMILDQIKISPKINWSYKIQDHNIFDLKPWS